MKDLKSMRKDDSGLKDQIKVDIAWSALVLFLIYVIAIQISNF